MAERICSNTGMRIALFGAYKTGTTGLFYKVRNSAPYSMRTLFEAKKYDRKADDSKTGVLAKVIIDADTGVDIGSYLEFERKVLLVRDPRDWVVSAAMFLPQEREKIYRNKDRLSRVLDMLAAKERDPGSQPFYSILSEILALGGDGPFDIEGYLKQHFAHFYSVTERLGSCQIQKYEDMIDDKWNDLESYIGFPLNASAKVDPAHAHVPRTLSYGNWRNWFLESDVEFFRDQFMPFMTKFGYADDWRLPAERSINPKFCTGYVKRVVDLKLGNMQPSFSYRLCQIEDGHEINRGFNEIFRQERSYADWRWKFLENQMPLKGVVGVDASGSIVSHFSVLHECIQVDGRRFKAGHPVDSYCLRRPGALSHRVFVKSVQEFYRHFRKKEHFGLFIGFPGKRHLRLGQLKLEYSASKPFAIWRRKRRPPVGWKGRLSAAFTRTPRILLQEPVKAWSERLWQIAEPRYPVAVIRDYEWNRCRYVSRPGRPYRYVGVERSGAPSAWSVFRASPGVLQWVDLVWDGRAPTDLVALDREADRLAREFDLSIIELWLSGDAVVESYLRQNGWTECKHPEDLGLSTLLIDEDLVGKGVLERFYITLGDTDLA